MAGHSTTSLLSIEVNDIPTYGVPFIVDDVTLALLLNLKPRILWYMIHQKSELYTKFYIKKATGGTRTIHSPEGVLKSTQRKIDKLILRKVPLFPCVGAYVEGQSCSDVAARHVGHSIRIGMDLKDFFPSHTRGRVSRFLQTEFKYNRYVSDLLADLLTAQGVTDYKHRVPQGSPASPTLCNIMAQATLDTYILRRLQGTGWTYSRYSDDLTLSHPENMSQKEVDTLLRNISSIVRRSGYVVNRKKTKIQRNHRRQRMLGIVINEKLSIPREVYKKYRAILHNCKRDGFELNAKRYKWDDNVQSFVLHLGGKVAYFTSIDPEKGRKLQKDLDAAILKHSQKK